MPRLTMGPQPTVLMIAHPGFDTELEIVQRKVPGIDHRLATQIVQLIHRIRQLNLRNLVVLGASVLSRNLITETLNRLLKDKDDIARTLQEAVR